MQKEDYKLLINECCNRLPYGVWVDLNGIRGKLNEIKIHHFFYDTNSVQDIKAYTDFFQDNEPIEICNFKLCLRPMSSMTENERKELISEFGADIRDEDNGRHTEEYGYVMVYHNFKEESWFIPFEAIDFLNAHHFDYRGLIEKGLAIDSTDLGIYGNLEE